MSSVSSQVYPFRIVSGVSPAASIPKICSQQCGAHETCARIRGHIPAASEVAGVETIGGRPATLGPPLAPFVADLGAAGQAADDALNRLFFLQVSHDGSVR